MLWIRIYIFESGSSCFLNGNADPDQGAFSMRIRIRREIECGSTRIRFHSSGCWFGYNVSGIPVPQSLCRWSGWSGRGGRRRSGPPLMRRRRGRWPALHYCCYRYYWYPGQSTPQFWSCRPPYENGTGKKQFCGSASIIMRIRIRDPKNIHMDSDPRG